ncbi:hypothetical protein L2E82_03074 [Cichorium intybus]|uniref:Uncharacterized protein n=1 Tax=Cichorium intybus TaxID=13427 RepID=A0ACB9H4V3_CICIN|nr:hypothetical protein L2E82_03074 [Cichorium intybus]
MTRTTKMMSAMVRELRKTVIVTARKRRKTERKRIIIMDLVYGGVIGQLESVETVLDNVNRQLFFCSERPIGPIDHEVLNFELSLLMCISRFIEARRIKIQLKLDGSAPDFFIFHDMVQEEIKKQELNDGGGYLLA